MERIEKHTAEQLQRLGFGCSGLAIEPQGWSKSATLTALLLYPAQGQAVPSLSEIGIGRCALITAADARPDLSNPQCTIAGVCAPAPP